MSALDLRYIDYYIKGLPFDIRQELFNRIDSIGEMTVKCLLEKDEGYPKYKRMGLTNEEIFNQIKKTIARFEAVNDIMIANERYPLFTDPSDTFQSSQEYTEMLERKSEEELIEFFGCTWDDYEPKVYKK